MYISLVSDLTDLDLSRYDERYDGEVIVLVTAHGLHDFLVFGSILWKVSACHAV